MCVSHCKCVCVRCVVWDSRDSTMWPLPCTQSNFALSPLSHTLKMQPNKDKTSNFVAEAYLALTHNTISHIKENNFRFGIYFDARWRLWYSGRKIWRYLFPPLCTNDVRSEGLFVHWNMVYCECVLDDDDCLRGK